MLLYVLILFSLLSSQEAKGGQGGNDIFSTLPTGEIFSPETTPLLASPFLPSFPVLPKAIPVHAMHSPVR